MESHREDNGNHVGIKTTLAILEREHEKLDKALNERYIRLEGKIDTFIATITAWMLTQESKVGKIDGKIAVLAIIAGAVGGALTGHFAK